MSKQLATVRITATVDVEVPVEELLNFHKRNVDIYLHPEDGDVLNKEDLGGSIESLKLVHMREVDPPKGPKNVEEQIANMNAEHADRKLSAADEALVPRYDHE